MLGKFTVNTHELAWAAGFFDGEGCTHFHTTQENFSLSIAQKDPRVLRRFQNLFPCTVVRSYRSRERYYNLYRTAKFEHVQFIIAAMWKYLGDAKREQYKKELSKFMNRPNLTRVVNGKMVRHTKNI